MRGRQVSNYRERTRTVLGVGLSVLLLLTAGCQSQPATEKADPKAVQREAEMLRKQNEEMLKR